MAFPLGDRLKQWWSQLVSDKRRKTLLIGGAVLLFCAFIYRLYPVYEGMTGDGTDIAALKKRVAKYRQVVDGKGVLESGFLSLNRSLARAEAGLLVGETEALAAVNIQNAINEIALAGGVEIKSMQVMKSQHRKQETAFYVSVPVQFNVTLTIRQLKDILYKIEAFPESFLSVQWIRISAIRTRDSGQIRCDMAVAGIMEKVNKEG